MEVEIKKDGTVILRGDASECARCARELIKQERSVFKDEGYPKRVTRVQPIGRKRKRKLSYRRWSKQEKRATKAFYNDVVNHYENGYIIPRKLKSFAVSIGRTPMAVQVRALELGFTERKLAGVKKMKQRKKQKSQSHRWTPEQKRKHSETMKKYHAEKKQKSQSHRWTPEQKRKHSETMKKYHAEKKQKTAGKVPNAPPMIGEKRTVKGYGMRFPTFRFANVENEVVKSTLYDMAVRKGRMNMQQAIILGISTRKQWEGFLEEMLRNSGRIADYFKVPKRFRVIATNDETVLAYE